MAGNGCAARFLCAAALCLSVGSTALAIDACALLTKPVIEKVQGEPLKQAKSSSQKSGALVNYQCFYSFATLSNSVSLSVMVPDPENASGAGSRELWEKWFHKEAARPEKDAGEEKEKAAEPTPVSGLGDEAYWVRSFVGTLYVLKRDAILRISLGGKPDDAARLQRARNLASNALSRLLLQLTPPGR